jgi:hypothetical protein
MLKKVFTNIISIISVFFLISNSIFAATNENATDIIIEFDGFCPNYVVPFIMFNQTQYEEKTKIEKRLCGDDEDPEEDRCEVWEEFEGTVRIHNGPLEGMQVLKEFKLDEKREFEFTFTTSNDFLVVYESEQDKYNDWEELITINECKFSNKSNEEEEEIKQEEKVNQTFLYDNNEIIIDLIDTTFENENEISLEIIENIELEKSIKTFEIKSENNTKTFSKIKIQMNINLENKEYEIYKFNSNSNKWEIIKIDNIEETETSLKFEISTLGKYSIIEKSEEIEINNENTNNNSSETINLESNTNSDNTPIELDLGKAKSQFSEINPGILIGGVIFVLAILGFLFIPKKRKEIDMTQYQSNQPINEESYKKTKEYVQKYKPQYNQEQIRKSLTAAKIDVNVIDKVLKEEF